MQPCPNSAKIVAWLEENKAAFQPVLGRDLRSAPPAVVDLSVSSTEIAQSPGFEDERASTEWIFSRMRAEGAAVGIGRYNEARLGYSSGQFQTTAEGLAQWRTIHIGMDLFVEPGSPVFSPLDGAIHGFQNNARPQDYGPTIILRHKADDAAFFTLYGHLSADSLEKLHPGKIVHRGEQIGSVGDSVINGGWPPHVHKAPMPDVYRGPFKSDDVRAGEKYASLVKEALAEIHQRGNRISAFICESALSCGGQIPLPPDYLKAAYSHVRSEGGVCIADEVRVGLGRIGSHFWGFEAQGVIPDIVTMGKSMGNGHPLAAVVTTPDLAASFETGMEYFNTYGGNPVSCAVGVAVLDVIEEEKLQAHALAVGEYLVKGLKRLMQNHPIIGDVRGQGLFLGVELVSDRESLAPAAAQASYIVERMCGHRILLSTDGPLHNVIKIKPPLAFTDADADMLLEVLNRVLHEDFIQASVAGSGFSGARPWNHLHKIKERTESLHSPCALLANMISGIMPANHRADSRLRLR